MQKPKLLRIPKSFFQINIEQDRSRVEFLYSYYAIQEKYSDHPPPILRDKHHFHKLTKTGCTATNNTKHSGLKIALKKAGRTRESNGSRIKDIFGQ